LLIPIRSAGVFWQSSLQRICNQYLNTTDYKCEDGRSPVSESCETISNPDWLSSSETGVKSRNQKLKPQRHSF
jgi:hypothetical protein